MAERGAPLAERDTLQASQAALQHGFAPAFTGPWQQTAIVVATELVVFGVLLAGLAVGDPRVFTGLSALAIVGLVALRRGTRLFELLGSCFRTRATTAQWALLGLLVLFPFTQLSSPFWIHTAVMCGIYVIMALGLNVVVGFAGLLDLGFVAFFAIGAYTSALLTVNWHWPFWLCLPAGALVALVFGVLLGAPALRLRGDYLALVTLAFGEMVRILVNNLDAITLGPSGISGISPPSIGTFIFSRPSTWFGVGLPPQVHYYFLVLALALATVLVVARLNDSRIGRAWNAIREDQLAAGVFGVDVPRVKLLAFGSGAFFGGISGVVFANMNTYISPDSFVFFQSVIVLCMIIFGGMGNIPGVVLGAVILIAVPEKLREYEHLRLLLFGVGLTAMMLFRPEGILPSERRRRELRQGEEAEV